MRLHPGDLKILWPSDGREYNPDFIAVEKGGTHWLVEAKMNKEMEAAGSWAALKKLGSS